MAYLNTKRGNVISLGTKGHKLTPKMMSFIDAYLGPANGVAIRAMEMSMYKAKSTPDRHAIELLQHPLVAAEIKRRMDIRAEKSEVKAEYLINKLMSIIEATETENPQAALRAIELAGKSIALWKERQEISGPDGGAIETEQRVKESAADFTSKLSGLIKRSGTDNNVVPFAQAQPKGAS